MTYLQQHARSIAEPAAFWAEQARSLAWYQAPIAGSPMAA